MPLLSLRWTSLLALTSLALGCSDAVTAPADAAPVDGGRTDAGTIADTGTSIDRPVTDVPVTDVPVTDVPVTDVPVTDVGTDVPRDVGNDRSGDAGDSCASTVEGAACSLEGQSCGGPCSDPCQFCNIFRCAGGRWTRLEIFPRPCTDAGGTDAGATDAGVSLPGARMLWEAPGGFAGTGPAVMVDADGTVRIWDTTRGVDLASPSLPTRTLRVAAAAASDLFARWARVDRSGLPHSGGGAECSGRVAYRACAEAGCRVETVMFSTAAQVAPEMNPVRQWFDDTLSGEMAAAYPRNYCNF